MKLKKKPKGQMNAKRTQGVMWGTAYLLFINIITVVDFIVVWQIVIWWPSQSEEVWPWSPMTGEKDRANMIIFAVNG